MFIVHIWSRASKRNNFLSGCKLLRIIMVCCWELFEVFVFYLLIKWSHCKSFSWLFHLFWNIIINSWCIWSLNIVWSIPSTKNMGSCIHWIATVNFILSNSWEFSLFTIWKRSITNSKTILSTNLIYLYTYWNFSLSEMEYSYLVEELLYDSSFIEYIQMNI